MISRIVDKYVLPAVAAAAAPAATGASAGAGGAAGAAGGSSLKKVATETALGSISSPSGGSSGGTDPITKGIRGAGRTAAGAVNALSSIPESAGSRYQADLARLRAQRYARPTQSNVNTGHPSAAHRAGLAFIKELQGHLDELSNQKAEIKGGHRSDFNRESVAMAKSAIGAFEDAEGAFTDEHMAKAADLVNELDMGYGGLSRFDSDGNRAFGVEGERLR